VPSAVPLADDLVLLLSACRLARPCLVCLRLTRRLVCPCLVCPCLALVSSVPVSPLSRLSVSCPSSRLPTVSPVVSSARRLTCCLACPLSRPRARCPSRRRALARAPSPMPSRLHPLARALTCLCSATLDHPGRPSHPRIPGTVYSCCNAHVGMSVPMTIPFVYTLHSPVTVTALLLPCK